MVHFLWWRVRYVPNFMFVISFIDCFLDYLEHSLPLLDQVFKSYKERAL